MSARCDNCGAKFSPGTHNQPCAYCEVERLSAGLEAIEEMPGKAGRMAFAILCRVTLRASNKAKDAKP